MFLRCCKQAFTYFVFRLVALIISYPNIRSCRTIQRHNGLTATISHTLFIALHCNQLECLLNWVRIKHPLKSCLNSVKGPIQKGLEDKVWRSKEKKIRNTLRKTANCAVIGATTLNQIFFHLMSLQKLA